jgi:hypothetical protein
MRRTLLAVFATLALVTISFGVTVTVNTPTNGSTVGTALNVNATASGSNKITAWHIYVDGQNVYSAGATSSVSANLNLTSGTHKMIVRAWDSTGAYGSANLQLTASSVTGSTGTKGVTITVSSPATTNVKSPVSFIASAASGASITAWRIYVDGATAFSKGSGKTLSATLPMAVGTHKAIVRAWNANGKYGDSVANLTVDPSTPPQSVGVTVSPASASVVLSGTHQFQAGVTGTTNTAVTWSVNGIVGGDTVVGTITSSGLYEAPGNTPGSSSVTVTATSVADATKHADATVALTSPVSGTSGGMYGPATNSDTLANTVVGPNCGAVSLRFRAATTSTLNALRTYVKTGSGYSAGTGGSWVVSIQTDDGSANHYPSGNTIASMKTTTLGGGGFPLFSFASPAQLTAGEVYHVVLTNADANPNTNYVSANALSLETPTSPLQPKYSDTDWMMLCKQTTWGVRRGYIPILELDYANGAAQGLGYVDNWVSAGVTFTGSKQVRETFTVSGSNRQVTAVSVRVQKVSGTGALNLRLEDGAGNLIEEGTVAANSISTTNAWVTYTFSGVRTLSVGGTYHLVLSSPSGTYFTFALQKGSGFGFNGSTYFSDGHAEVNSGTGWAGFANGSSPRTDGDLQFYFKQN